MNSLTVPEIKSSLRIGGSRSGGDVGPDFLRPESYRFAANYYYEHVYFCVVNLVSMFLPIFNLLTMLSSEIHFLREVPPNFHMTTLLKLSFTLRLHKTFLYKSTLANVFEY